MALTSTVEIQLDDSKFARFKETFDRYDAALKKQPEAWKKINAMQAAGTTQFEKQTKLIGDQADSARDMVNALGAQNNALRQSERLWVSMARSGKELGGSIIGATTSLLKWTGILGLVGGVLGLGGLLGVGSLAFSEAGMRRSAKGRGMEIGAQNSFGVNFDRFVDTDSFMDQVSAMETDIRLQKPGFVGLGRGLSGDTETDALALLRKGFATAHSVGNVNQLGMQFQGAGLSDMFDSAAQMRLFKYKPDEFEAQLAHYKTDKRDMTIDEKIALHGQDAATALERLAKVGEATGAALADKLMQKIPELVAQFENLIKSFGRSGEIKAFIDMLADAANAIMHPVDSAKKLAAWDVGLGNKWDKGVSNFFTDAWASNHKDLFMEQLSAQSGLPGWALGAVSRVESSNNDNAVGAMTRWGTAKGRYGLLDMNSKGINPFDFVEASHRTADKLSGLMKEFHGDVAKVFAAYHSGEGTVEAAQRKYGTNWRQGLGPAGRDYVQRFDRLIIENNTGGSATVEAAQLGSHGH